MNNPQLYLAMQMPQWEIFLGIALLLAGYVEKKVLLIKMGWIVLIITGLTALYFNLTGSLGSPGEGNATNQFIITTGWQCVLGGVLAGLSLLLLHLKSKRYIILAILTIIYFILTFFLYYQASHLTHGTESIKQTNEQKM